MIIAIDFDGTLVDHRFPKIGMEVPGAFKWLKEFQAAGAKLMLWTMRGDGQEAGDVLKEAVEFCRQRGIEFWGINENPDQARTKWSTSHKQHANIFIDDAAFGCPLRENSRMGGHPYVDWSVVGPAVMQILNS